MKIRRSFALAAALVGALLLASTQRAWAQQGEAHAGREPGVAETEALEHGHHGPEAVNWLDFGCSPHAQTAGAHKLPPPFIASFINFVLLAALVMFGIRRGINPALAERRTLIEAEIGEAQRLRSEAEAMHREYTERLENMEAEFTALREEFIRAGETEHKRILEEAAGRAERLRKDAQEAIAQEIKQLRVDLTREAVEAAIGSAEKAVRAGINTQDHGRLTDDYLVHIEKTPRGAA